MICNIPVLAKLPKRVRWFDPRERLLRNRAARGIARNLRVRRCGEFLHPDQEHTLRLLNENRPAALRFDFLVAVGLWAETGFRRLDLVSGAVSVKTLD